MILPRPLVLFHYRKSGGRYAMNVLAGAIEASPGSRHVEVAFPESVEETATLINGAVTGGRPVLVAWSFYSPQFETVLGELARVRALAPGAVHVAGGVHASAEPELTLRGGFDLAAVGDGEPIIAELARRLGRGEPLQEIPGVASLEQGRLVRRGRARVESLNPWPPGAPGQFRFGPMEITRGCIYACKFCHTPFFGKARFRHRSLPAVRAHVAAMHAAEVRDYRFITPSALSYGAEGEEVNLAAVEGLLTTVRETAGPDARIFFGTFPSELRPEHVTPAAVALLRRHVYNDNLIIGAQSGAQPVLERSGRGHDVEAVRAAVRYSLEAGFKVNVDFLFGLPGETEDEVRQSLAFAQELARLGARIHGHAFMPLPGTPYKDAPPAQLSPETERVLKSLAARGQLYGPWQGHVDHAARLAQLRQHATKTD
jgi:B12-binding domain/radical SAM domain protein